jgi:hypothetical protein
VLSGVGLCIAGLIGLFMSVAMDANRHHMPLVESEWAKRAVTGALGLVFIFLGVGMARLRPWVLYSLPIFFTVGVTIQTAAGAYEYSSQPAPPIWVMFSGAVVTLIVVLAMMVGIRSLWHPVERTAFLNGLSPEQRTVYTHSVAPLGVFLLIAAVSSLTLVSILPTDRIYVPFFETGLGKRALFFGVGLLYALLGVGMVRLWRWAWYLLLAVIVGSGVLVVVGVEISRLGGEPGAGYVPAIVAGSFNAVFGLGIWIVTRRAFRQSNAAG